jgi:phosphopantetheinyl transferase
MTAIDVQLVPVVGGAAEDPILLSRLTDADRYAAASFGFAADRDRSVTARAAARLELARRLGVAPSDVPLLPPELSGGRPVVRGTTICVGWAHSGAWVALAYTRDRAVGIDIELGPEEVPLRALATVGVHSLEEFVAREAAGKATGQGLAGGWPRGVRARMFETPDGYVGAVAAHGDDWSIHMVPSLSCAPPAKASATAIGLSDMTGAGSRRAVYSC